MSRTAERETGRRAPPLAVMLDTVAYKTRTHWAALVAGAIFVAAGVALGAGPYHDRRAFERAPYCGPAVRGDCVTRMRMTVLSRSTYTTEDPDPNWPPPQPPPQPPPPPQGPFGPFGPYGMGPPVRRAMAVLPMSQTTHYRLTVRTEDGRRHTYEVGADLYRAARTGTTGTAEVWHGRVQRLRVASYSDDQWSYLSLGVAWVLAWIGLMLIVGLGLPLAEVAPALPIGAWWAGIVAFAVLHAWHPALWVVPLVAGGAVLVIRAGALFARR